jgi:uncharacterized protein (DUF1697 family)
VVSARSVSPKKTSSQCIALLRGVNVGRTRRIAMSELRALVEALGHTNVRTVLNSGNVVFEASRPHTAPIASAIEAALEGRFGFRATTMVLTADELGAIIRENPLAQIADDASRHLVAFVASPATLAQAKLLLARSWTPDAFAVGKRAAYLWCARGLIESRLAQAFARSAGEAATTRNWATVLKLHTIATSGRDGA